MKHETNSKLQADLAEARLYAITAELEPSRLLDLVPRLVRSGADAVQLRHPGLDRARLLDLARKLNAACKVAGALFIVNDHLDLALLSGAAGVHLGAGDLSVEAARRVAGTDLLIGASASTPASARAAVAAGADYLGTGPVFPTPLKPDRPVLGPAGVAAIARAVPVPVFAIGGIDAGNVGLLREHGIDRVCVIRALVEAADPEREAGALRMALPA